MIAPLRRRHRTATLVVAVAAPTVLVAAVLARNPVPATDAAELTATGVQADLEPLTGTRTLWPDEATGLTWTVHRLADRVVVDLAPLGDPLPPDLLVYRVDAVEFVQPHVEGPIVAPTGVTPLPDGAVLLGAFDGQRTARFDVIATGLGEAPSLVLYSLGHGTVVAGVHLAGPSPLEPAPQDSAPDVTPPENFAAPTSSEGR